MAPPAKLAHVVYMTRRFDEMISWYQTVFEAKVQYQNPAFAFLTFDSEHHRFAFVNMDVMGAVLHKEVVPINQLVPTLPQEIERIVNKTLRKDREQRYQTAKDLLIDLKDANEELDFQNKKERSTAPQTPVATAVRSTDAKSPTSSAEFITQEVKKHKLGVMLSRAETARLNC